MLKQTITAVIIAGLIGLSSAPALAQISVKKTTAKNTLTTKKTSVVKTVKTVPTANLKTVKTSVKPDLPKTEKPPTTDPSNGLLTPEQSHHRNPPKHGPPASN